MRFSQFLTLLVCDTYAWKLVDFIKYLFKVLGPFQLLCIVYCAGALLTSRFDIYLRQLKEVLFVCLFLCFVVCLSIVFSSVREIRAY